MSCCFAANKRVLVVVAHQDDESLFCGGLLSQIRGTGEVTVICMSQPKKQQAIEFRNECFRKVCEKVEALAITTGFSEARHVWSSAELFRRKRPQQIAAMTKLLHEQAERLRPDIIITHNARGEYGHCYHKVVHQLCRQIFPPDRLYFIGAGSKSDAGRTFVVRCDPLQKRELLALHPYLDPASFCKRHFGKDITDEPETYVACEGGRGSDSPPGNGAILWELSADFLGFWIRKLRAKLYG